MPVCFKGGHTFSLDWDRGRIFDLPIAQTLHKVYDPPHLPFYHHVCITSQLASVGKQTGVVKRLLHWGTAQRRWLIHWLIHSEGDGQESSWRITDSTIFGFRFIQCIIPFRPLLFTNGALVAYPQYSIGDVAMFNQ